MKTSELTGHALDWAVAKAEYGHEYEDIALLDYVLEPEYGMEPFEPSTNWTFGGPIIEREKITLDVFEDGVWVASEYKEGPTPLIAAMRCFVASRLGDEVNIPEELQ